MNCKVELLNSMPHYPFVIFEKMRKTSSASKIKQTGYCEYQLIYIVLKTDNSTCEIPSSFTAMLFLMGTKV
jgi:hypothetical protein